MILSSFLVLLCLAAIELFHCPLFLWKVSIKYFWQIIRPQSVPFSWDIRSASSPAIASHWGSAPNSKKISSTLDPCLEVANWMYIPWEFDKLKIDGKVNSNFNLQMANQFLPRLLPNKFALHVRIRQMASLWITEDCRQFLRLQVQQTLNKFNWFIELKNLLENHRAMQIYIQILFLLSYFQRFQFKEWQDAFVRFVTSAVKSLQKSLKLRYWLEYWRILSSNFLFTCVNWPCFEANRSHPLLSETTIPVWPIQSKFLVAGLSSSNISSNKCLSWTASISFCTEKFRFFASESATKRSLKLLNWKINWLIKPTN